MAAKKDARQMSRKLRELRRETLAQRVKIVSIETELAAERELHMRADMARDKARKCVEFLKRELEIEHRLSSRLIGRLATAIGMGPAIESGKGA